eukprot:Clim_evm6s214 gene=Clim_evmTU6s214
MFPNSAGLFWLLLAGTVVGQSCDQPETVKLKVIYRDLMSGYDYSRNKDNNIRHLDCDSSGGLLTGMVEDTLGADGTPTIVTIPDRKRNVHTAESWWSWYHDVDHNVYGTLGNKRIEDTIELTLDRATGQYTFNSAPLGSRGGFFPMDGRGFDDHNTRFNHNYCFTSQISTSFTFQGDETFSFRGDDDVWVFVNKHLLIDIGGLHSAKCRTVKLGPDSPSPNLPFGCSSVSLDQWFKDNLVVGETYQFDMFHAERHTTSSNFYLTTTLAFQGESETSFNYIDTPLATQPVNLSAGTTYNYVLEISGVPDDDVDVNCFATTTDNISDAAVGTAVVEADITNPVWSGCTDCDGCFTTYTRRVTVPVEVKQAGTYYLWCQTSSSGPYGGLATTGVQIVATV